MVYEVGIVARNTSAPCFCSSMVSAVVMQPEQVRQSLSVNFTVVVPSLVFFMHFVEGVIKSSMLASCTIPLENMVVI